MIDVVVVGGSFAGMSAALQLARACRTVRVIDAGKPRNRRAARAHGCLGWDGAAPADILAQGRSQLLAYERVSWTDDEVQRITGSAAQGFQVKCRSGAAHEARRVVLAHGVVDHLPDIPGLDERWGRSVLHCPYCHGYEICGGAIGALVSSVDGAEEQVRALQQWGRVQAFHDGGFDAQDLERIASSLEPLGVSLERSALVAITDTATLQLADERSMKVDALFIHPDSSLAAPMAEALGCEVESAGCITTDSAKQTTVPGVFACGDAARFAGNIALAVGEGALAGVAAHRSLLGLLE